VFVEHRAESQQLIHLYLHLPAHVKSVINRTRPVKKATFASNKYSKFIKSTTQLAVFGYNPRQLTSSNGEHLTYIRGEG
jgi:hypothetical protein